jgi:hypothetical protein
MGVRKLSISLDEEVATAARAAAKAAGLSLSAWLARAATEAAGIEAGLEGVREYEAEHGKLTEAELAWADEVLDRHGIGRR